MPQERVEIIFVAKGQRQVERSIAQLAQAADKASKAIDRMGKTGGGTAKVGKSAQTASRDVKRLGNDATKTAGRVNSLWKSLVVPAATGASIRDTGRAINSLVGRFAAFYTGRTLIGISDEFNRLGNVLKGFGVAAKEVDRVRKSINKVSNEARVDALQAATLFGRLRQATQGMALSSRELVQIVGTVNKALRLGGASSLEASQSIRQLSQAFNKGKLDGDEFRSVMENAPILQDLLTEKLGVTKDALFGLAAAGKITAADLVGAFQQGAEEIDRKFLGQVKTLGDALTVLKNEFREAFGAQVSGPASILANIIVALAKNMETLVQAFTVFAAAKVFGAAIAGAQRLLGVMKSINVQAAAGALGGLISGKRAVKGDYNTMMLQAMGQSVGRTSRLAGLGAGAARLLPGIGQAAMVATLIPVMADLIKSLLGVGDAAKKVETDLDRLNKFVQAKFLVGEGDPSRALPDASPSFARRAAEYRKPDVARRARMTRQISYRTTDVLGMPGSPFETAEQQKFNRDIDEAIRELNRDAKQILEDVKSGLDSLRGFSEEELRAQAPDLERMFELLESSRALAKKDKGITDSASQRAFSKMVGREFSVSTDELDKVLGSVRFSVADIIPIWRKYKDAIPFTEQEKLGDSLMRSDVELEKYRERLKELTDEKNKFQDATTEVATAIAYNEEQIRKLLDPLGQENVLLDKQLETLEKLKSFMGYDELTAEQSAALADQSALQNFLRTAEKEGVATAVESLQANIEKKSVIQDILDLVGRANRKLQEQKNAETSILNILEQKRAALEAIGKTEQQLERERFADLAEKAGKPEKVQEFRELVSETALANFDNKVKESIQSLQDVAVLLEEARSQATSPEQLEAFDKILQQFKDRASELGAAIGTSGREGSEQILRDAGEQLKLTAGETGTILGSALANAFNAAVAGIEARVGALGSSGAIAPGSVPPLGPSGPASLGPGQQFLSDTQISKIDQLSNKVGGLDSQITRLGETITDSSARFTQFNSTAGTALRSAGNSAKNTANDIQQFFEGAFGSLEDALVGFVTTGKLDFKSLINSIIADLARMVIRMLIIKPLMGFFGGIFGFSGGGIVPGFKNGGVIPGYAPGGIVTGFGGARSDNQLAALSPGEMGSLEYINKTGKMPPTRDGGSTVFAPSIVINQQGNDPEVTAQMVDAAVKRSWTELAVKSQRKGGVFDRRGG
jgi:tape measure domain-containing protein